MKKCITIMSIILCFCLCLCACGFMDNPSMTDVPLQDNENSPVSAQIYPLDYDSLFDLKRSINQKNQDTLYAQLIEKGANNEQIDKVKFFVEKFQSQNIVVPYLDGKVIEFRNEEGFSNIALFASEAYGLPWIWYWPVVSTGENFYMKVTYLPDSINKTPGKLTASDVIKELSPNSPNINNLGKQHEKIYNQIIKLGDREVTALVCEYKTDNRNSFIFIYKDLLVEIRCDPEVWNAQWFATLSFDSFNE